MNLPDEGQLLRRRADRLIDDLQELSDRALALNEWGLRSDLLAALSLFKRGAGHLDHAVWAEQSTSPADEV